MNPTTLHFSCEDGVKHGRETDVDCGGTLCPKCAEGKNCTVDHDCEDELICGNEKKTCVPRPVRRRLQADANDDEAQRNSLFALLEEAIAQVLHGVNFDNVVVTDVCWCCSQRASARPSATFPAPR